jgi:lipopolysaccharide export system protein LptA
MNARKLIVIAALLLSAPAFGQSLSFSSKDPDQPIDVTAEQGIEWRQNEKLFIARGNAKATQGNVSVTADELTAHYRATPSGGTEVFRVDALGNVKMVSAEETATGGAAIYDFDKSVLVMEGDDIVLTTAKGSVTAHRAIQYWANERVAVAEGNAEARDEDRRLQADRITAYFKEAPAGPKKNTPGGNELRLVQGEGNVRMTTAKEVIRGQRGEYNLETGVAKLDGSVNITKENNQLSGAFAVVDTKAGTSRLFGSAREAGVSGPADDSRVKALLAPKPRREPLVPRANGG